MKFCFRLFGSLMSIGNLIGIYLYLMNQQFTSNELYNLYCIAIITRIIFIIVVSSILFFKNLILTSTSFNEQEGMEDPEKKHENLQFTDVKQQHSFMTKGLILYSHMPFMLLFGCYRLYKPRDFKHLLKLGFLLEFLLQLLPALII